MKNNWEEKFNKLWNELVDWAGSGFRYQDSSFTAKGLDAMKPKFYALLQAESDSCSEALKQMNKAYNELKEQDRLDEISKITRLEVIDETGRAYVKWDCQIEQSFQR